MSEVPAHNTQKLPPRVFAVMAMTTLSTFGVLVTSYTLLFPGPFA